MRIQETVTEVKRFLRATQDSFDSLTEGKDGDTYAVTYGLTLQTDAISSSEIKSLLAAIDRSVSAFSGDGKISVQLDVNHQNGFDGQLLKGVRNGYEASKKIEAPAATAPEAKVS